AVTEIRRLQAKMAIIEQERARNQRNKRKKRSLNLNPWHRLYGMPEFRRTSKLPISPPSRESQIRWNT
ncbi:hypothetical protein A2U01_0075526, partial [Trifolium medium]|nr:hypothetical protein [Trifolium medium]